MFLLPLRPACTLLFVLLFGAALAPAQGASRYAVTPSGEQVPMPHLVTRAETLEMGVAEVLKRPEVYLASTVPAAPLLTTGNRLEAVVAPTPNVVGEMARLIDNSHSEVLLQIYEWNSSDEAAQKVMAALEGRIERALTQNDPLLVVRVVVSHAYLSENNNKQDDLQRLIGRVRTHPRAAGRVEIELSSYRGMLLSILHTKTLLIDQHTALVMTGNLNTHGGVQMDSFNAAMRLTGPVVHTLRQDWLSARALATPVAVSLDGDFPDEALAKGDVLGAEAVRLDEPRGAYAAVLSRQSSWKPWSTGEDNPQDRGIVALLDGAQERIDIVNPSLGVKSVQDALLRAMHERNVEVRVLLSFAMNRWREHTLLGGDNFDHVARLYARLLREGGAALADKLSIAWGSSDGIGPSDVHEPGNIHAKIINIDDCALVMGSTNLNRLSWNNSRELSVAMMDDDIALPFRKHIFEPLWAASAPLRAEQLSLHASTTSGWPLSRAARPDEVSTYLRKRAVRERDAQFTPRFVQPRLGYPARPRT